MTRFGAFVHRQVERMLGKYYEGPEAPPRLRQNVLVFAKLHAKATVADWVEFAADFADECYRSGYIRGLNWAARDLDRRDPVADPEVLADKREHDWDWSQLGPSEQELAHIVSRNIEDDMSPEERALMLDQIGRETGGFRIVVEPVRDLKRR